MILPIKRSIANAVMLAAVSAGTTWLANLWFEQRRARRHSAARRDLKSQVKSWETEGGAVHPPVVPPESSSN